MGSDSDRDRTEATSGELSESRTEGSARVSVVMTAYRPDPRFLVQAVESVLHQTMAEWELIIVEDPSEVDGREMLVHLDDPRIIHIRNARRTSHSMQHNQGLDRCRGEYIAILDADDICEPDRLARQREFLEQHESIGVVGSSILVIDEDSNTIARRRYPEKHPAVAHALRYYNAIANPSVMFRRSLIREFGGWDEHYTPAQDYEWWCRLMGGGVRFENLQSPVIRYRVHAGANKLRLQKETIRKTLEVQAYYSLVWYRVPLIFFMLLEALLLLVPTRLVHKVFVWARFRKYAPPTA